MREDRTRTAAGPRTAAGRFRGEASKTYAVVEVFFGTDHKVESNSSIKARFTNKRGSLAYGLAKVSVPAHHRMGQLERPKWHRLEFREDPEKHIVLLAADTMSQREYFDLFKKQLLDRSENKAFIFVHGYNVSFEDAALRTGQIAFDLDFKGLPVFYSWPSQGNPAKYTVDEANVEWTEANLQLFFEQFATDSNADEIFVIAHSMGSRAATRALLALLKAQPRLAGKYKEIVLAAPDIDADVFKRSIVPGFTALSHPVTLYASSEDKALMASKGVHGSPRAGNSGPLIVLAPGLETVDATTVDTNFLGHSYFVESRVLLTDMSLLLEERTPVSRDPA